MDGQMDVWVGERSGSGHGFDASQTDSSTGLNTGGSDRWEGGRGLKPAGRKETEKYNQQRTLLTDRTRLQRLSLTSSVIFKDMESLSPA